MSFLAQFYKFGKKENSFKIPYDGGSNFTMNVELKGNCSVVNPVILVDIDSITEAHDTHIFKYNYVYIPQFERYYYIDDWQYVLGVWAAYCHVDALGSWRYQVLENELYIMRSSYDENGNLLFDGDIPDSKYPVKASQPTYSCTSTGNPYSGKEGVYIVGIINSESSSGAVTYYAFNAVGFNYFCRKMFNNTGDWINIDPGEISEDLQKALINPFQYVVSCQYLPLNVGDVASVRSGVTTDITFGWWSINVPQGASIIQPGASIRYTSNLTIPRNASRRGYYLNMSPYAMYTLRYYPYGTMNIDTEAIAHFNTLDCYSDLDICTGKGILNICANGFDNPLRTVEAQVGVSIPTACIQTNYQNISIGGAVATSAASAVIGTLGENNTPAFDTTGATPDYGNAGGIKEFFAKGREGIRESIEGLKGLVPSKEEIKKVSSDILSGTVAAYTTAELIGMMGNASGYDTQRLTLSARFLPIATEDLTHTGRPLMQTKKLSTLRGFTIAKDGDIELPSATDREIKTIKAYLESGFFVE